MMVRWALLTSSSERANDLLWSQQWDDTKSKRWIQLENCASKSTANDKKNAKIYTKPIVFSAYFIIFALVTLARYSIYWAVVCFSTIIKIASILALRILWVSFFLVFSEISRGCIFLWLHRTRGMFFFLTLSALALFCIFSGICLLYISNKRTRIHILNDSYCGAAQLTFTCYWIRQST